MRRRALLACVLSTSIAGCSDDDPLTGDEAPDDEEADGDEDGSDGHNETDDDGNEVGESTYRVVVEPPELDPGEGPVCEFEALPDAAREEFEAAIEGVDFETDDRGEYVSEGSPALLDTDCYNGYIDYEGDTTGSNLDR